MSQRNTPNVFEVKIMPLAAIRPSPENDDIYRPIDKSDPDFLALRKSIEDEGVMAPLIISEDNYIISGHRRYAAAKEAGVSTTLCKVMKGVSRERDLQRFLKLLADNNLNRVKTADEQLREAVVRAEDLDPYAELLEQRRQKSDLSDFQGERIDPSTTIRRKGISEAKYLMLDAALSVIRSCESLWPLSVRQVHYRLVHLAILRHARKPESAYKNDKESYKDLCDLLTRARLTGQVPFVCIEDETRPFVMRRVWENVGPYITGQIEHFLGGYRRNLMQSQPNHIEIIGEKLTVKGIIDSVAADYQIPFTIGRGYSSIPPRQKMAERFRRSGRDKLVLLFLADFDPEGENIPQSFTQSLARDFGIDKERIYARKIALTKEQGHRLSLPPSLDAKPNSSRYKKFVAKYGPGVWELEALPPETLAQELRRGVDSVIDWEAFENERKLEAEDARMLAKFREQARTAFRDSGMS